jgi:hypothetical protein
VHELSYDHILDAITVANGMGYRLVA